jgi:predicted metalloprotease
LHRLITITLALCLTFSWTLGALPQSVAAFEQPRNGLPAIEVLPLAPATDAADIEATAVELSQMEADRDFAGLYDRLHPDSRALVSFDVFSGWYEALLAGKTTDELTVTEINFIDWTWGVNGVTYRDTAQVRFVQPYWIDGVRDDVASEFHLVEDDGEWYWFFGGSQDFIDQQAALYGSAPDNPAAIVEAGAAQRAIRFPDVLHAHVDAYWAHQFAAAGRDYTSPGGVTGFDSRIETGCGVADPVMEAAFYCVLDQTIYYSTDFRELVEAQIGDYGWVVVIAHEWGHHVQLELGSDLVGALDQIGTLAPIELEQQADCLAGAYTQSAEQTGWLDETDFDEAVFMTSLSGDPVGTSWADPNAHGSGEERVGAFLQGYGDGLAGCDLDLED